MTANISGRSVHLSFISYQSSIINHQLSVISYQLSVISKVMGGLGTGVWSSFLIPYPLLFPNPYS
ncbi:MAG: hypothetical protein EWV40_12530 [Microcystis flos-aquae Mf_WU_F_19750830_S460]|uniref:Uncharacterized protein n=1 Tax=Microcystis flos-aquae Mf_WU_F_19750830_S460 TaxID=2486237 RepID=A0A552LLB7_9CHRO|nr:MAG: hypothetical protein EWV40_12530 [Microcystis flos-aquae Mf_WU_F_19750830_S460]